MKSKFSDDGEALEEAARMLEAHADYKVIRRIVPRKQYAQPDGRPLLKGVIVDTETTGLNHDKDAIIELGMVLFEYDPETGQVFRVLETFDELGNPGFPIPPESTAIHGITDAMVADKRIDDAKVEKFLKGVSIAIAHNAGFDRIFLEKRLQVFESLPWACSFEQIDWRGEGIGSSKLDYIAYQFGFFFDGHRAEADCFALLEILQQTLPKSGVLALKSVLDQSSQKSYRVCATGSPFETKDMLKARFYKWDADKRYWNKTVTGADALKLEVAWLKAEVYGGRNAKLEFEVLDGLTRFSKRPGKKVNKEI